MENFKLKVSDGVSISLKKGDKGWGLIDFLVYSPLISTGIDYVKPTFQKMFGLYTKGSCVAREFAQMLNRIRNLNQVNGKIKRISICCPDLPTSTLPTDKNIISAHTDTLNDYIKTMSVEAYLMDIFTHNPEDFLMLPANKTYLYHLFVEQMLERNVSENDPGHTLMDILSKHYQVSGSLNVKEKPIPVKRLLNDIVKERESLLLASMESIEPEKPSSFKSFNPANKKRGLKDVYDIDVPNEKIFQGHLPLTTDKALDSYTIFKDLYFHWVATFLKDHDKTSIDILSNITHPQVVKWIQTNVFDVLNTNVIDPKVSKADLLSFWNYSIEAMNLDELYALFSNVFKDKFVWNIKDPDYVEVNEAKGLDHVIKESLNVVNSILKIMIGCKLVKNNSLSKKARMEDDFLNKEYYKWGRQGDRFSSMAKHTLMVFSPYSSMDDLYKPLGVVDVV